MRGFLSLLFVALLITSARFAVPQAQPIPISPSSYTHRWDAAHGVFFLQKNTLLLKDSPPLRSYNDDATQRSADINLFKDFPDAQRAHVDDFAAGPGGTTIVAAQLIYAPRLVKSVILTYDSTGTLRTIVHPEPYSAEAITVDDEGNMYLLGERTDEREGDPPYPLLIKYDPSGNVLSRAIYSNIFKGGSDAIQSFGPGEELVSATVALQNGDMYIFAPDEKEVLICSVDGKILRRAMLQNILQAVARADKRTGSRLQT